MPKKDIELNNKDSRTNYKIISSTSEPVYTSSISINNPTMPTVTEDLGVAYNKLGKRFSVNTGSQTFGSGSSTPYFRTAIAIPANLTMYIDRMRAGATASSVITFWSLSSNPIGATNTMRRICTNVGSGKTSNITAAYFDISGTSFSATTTNTLILTIVLTSGTYETDLGGRIIFPASTFLGIQVQNLTSSGSGIYCMTNVSWWEV